MGEKNNPAEEITIGDALKRVEILEKTQELMLQIADQELLLNVLKEICKSAQQIVNTPYVFVQLVDRTGKYLIISDWGPLSSGEENKIINKKKKRFLIGTDGVTGACAASGRIINVPDVSKDQRYIRHFKDAKSELAIPLKHGEQLLGVLNLESPNPDHFTPQRVGYSEHLAALAAIKIRQELDHEKEKKERKFSEAMNDIDRCLLEPMSEQNNVLRIVLSAALNIAEADCGHIQVQDPGTDLVEIKVWKGDVLPDFLKKFKIGKDGITGRVARELKTYRVDDVREVDYYEATFRGVRSELTVPMVHEGKYLGNIDVNNKEVAWFNEEDEEHLEKLADRAAVAVLMGRPSENQCQSAALMAVEGMAESAAHQIKNHLSTVGVYLDSLDEEIENERLSPDGKKAMKEIIMALQTSNESMEKYWRRIVKSQYRDIEMKTFCLNEFIDQQCELLGLKENGAFRLIPPEEEITVRSDPEILSEIIMNLVNNAKEELAESQNPQIVISYGTDWEKREEIQIVVQDNGRGIPRDELAAIFVPKQSKKPNGLGLGLPSSKKLANRLGGDLTFTSELGVGTKFILNISRS